MAINKVFKRVTVMSLAAASVVVATASTVAAAPIISEPGVYAVSYADSLYDYNGQATRYLDYADWTNMGQPAPTAVASDVVKYAWSPTLYAVTYFENDWLWEDLSMREWQRMGNQAPRDAGWIAGSIVLRYATSPQELFIRGADGVQHKLTYAEWAATPFRPFQTLDHIGFYQIAGMPTIYRADPSDPNMNPVALTFAQWTALGSPTPAPMPLN